MENKSNCISDQLGSAALFACRPSGSTDMITVSKKPVFVSEEDTDHTNANSSSAAESQVYSLPHMPRCQLRASVLSDCCLETKRRLSEHANTGSVWTRAVKNMALLKMPIPREYQTPWDLLFLLFNIIACMNLNVYIPVIFRLLHFLGRDIKPPSSELL